MEILKKGAFSLLIFYPILNFAQENQTDSTPKVHGTVRAKYEYNFQENSNRFSVRNARLDVRGAVHQTVNYRAGVDICEEGSIKAKSIYMDYIPLDGLTMRLGYSKYNFGIDNNRAFKDYYFTNRPFVAKYFSAWRNLGVSASYEHSKTFPFSLTAGVFNSTTFQEQMTWRKKMNYVFSLNLGDKKHYLINLSANGDCPENLYNYTYSVGLSGNFFGFNAEAEYVFRNYENKAFTNAHGLNCFLNYNLTLPKTFEKLSFGARYEIMNKVSNGKANQEGKLIANYPDQQRLTAGITLYWKTKLSAYFRLNYEKYFLPNNFQYSTENGDKIIAEFSIYF